MMGNLAFILTAFLVLLAIASSRNLENRELRIPDSSFPPQKRPFCNAFTGCGRKRSDSSMMSLPLPGENDSTLTRISNRLMAEARLWEMLQQRLAEAAGMADVSNELSQDSQLSDLLSSNRRKRSLQETTNQL